MKTPYSQDLNAEVIRKNIALKAHIFLNSIFLHYVFGKFEKFKGCLKTLLHHQEDNSHFTLLGVLWDKM